MFDQKKLFCFTCRGTVEENLLQLSKNADSAFARDGFSNWKNAMQAFRKHVFSCSISLKKSLQIYTSTDLFNVLLIIFRIFKLCTCYPYISDVYILRYYDRCRYKPHYHCFSCDSTVINKAEMEVHLDKNI